MDMSAALALIEGLFCGVNPIISLNKT